MDTDIKTPAGPVMDVAPPPPGPVEPAETPPEPHDDPTAASKPDPKRVPPVPGKSEAKSGVALAIVATVFIVIALAGLATYAYLKSR